MRLNFTYDIRRRVRQSAVTLLELMVAMSILTFIIFGLYSMFDKTQKAFLETTTQKDVLESGRSFMDIMVRDLEQMRASKLIDRTNLYIQEIVLTNGMKIPGINQSSMLGSSLFTNIFHEFYFLTKTSQWTAIGYRLSSLSTNNSDWNMFTNLGVGSLHRFSYTTNDFYHKTNDLFPIYYDSQPGVPPFQFVADGVVHLALRAYDRDGNWVDTSGWSYTNTFLPSWLELEVGVLEPKVLLQARSIPDPTAQRAFLQETTNRASAVHLFRQRIPVRIAN